MFETLPKRLLSAIIAPPIALFIMNIQSYVTLTESERIDTPLFDFNLFQFFWATYVFFFPFFLLVGVPLS